jgi:hypothetical protein
VEKVVHQHLNSLHMTNLEPGNPHYFFLAAMVFPRRPLKRASACVLSGDISDKVVEEERWTRERRVDDKRGNRHTWYRCADLEPSIPSDASNLGET